MGAGSGGGYASSPSSAEAFNQNIERLGSKFPRDQQGRFGRPGRRSGVHIVRTPDPGKTTKQFYDTLGSGGVEKPLPGGKGWRSRFDDGSSVVYRPSSKLGSPAVEIIVNTAKGDRYKIHFEH